MKRNKYVIKQSNVKYLLKSYCSEKLTFSKLPFSDFKKFVTRSVFGALQLRQMSLNFKTSYCNLKIRDLGAKLWLFYYFNFEWNYDGFKVKDFMLFLEQKYKL